MQGTRGANYAVLYSIIIRIEIIKFCYTKLTGLLPPILNV